MKSEVELNGKLTADAAGGSGLASRIREAAKEELPLEQMLLQLREIIVGPTERVSEARLDEMLDILDELKGSSNQRIDAVTTRVENVTIRTEQIKKGLTKLNRMLGKLDDRVTDNARQLRDVFTETIAQSHGDLEKQIRAMPEMMQVALGELEGKMRRSLHEMSASLSAHIAEDESARKRDREVSMSTLEQRIAQWRAEIEDMRRDDMQDVASSMMEIGKRLMALRKM